MTNPNPQPQPPRDERQDELIASVIAFAAIGTVLFLGLGRLGTGQIFSSQRLNDGSEGIGDSAGGDGGTLFGFVRGDRDDPEESLIIRGDEDSRVSRAASQDEDDVVLRQRTGPEGDRLPPVVAVAPANRLESPLTPAETDVTAAAAPTVTTDSPDGETTQQAEPAPAPTGEAQPLADIESDYWAAPFIDRLTGAGIIAGFNDGTFRPEQPVTRAEFAAQLAQAFPVDDSDG
ncbi:MAG: S-layer homology domain-containing protein, partial [Elainellaceae cyanobacterium]